LFLAGIDIKCLFKPVHNLWGDFTKPIEEEKRAIFDGDYVFG